jgi:tetratricopeptide (TPR) repeat protein
VTGKVLTTASERARTRDQVLAAATSLAVDVREALGDDTSDSTRRFAADTLSATSIDVVRNYAAAMEAQADGRFEEALAGFRKALDGDPNFGLAYAGMASSSRNLERFEEAEKYAREAARLVGRMTERERYRARGLLSMATGDYQQCLEEFREMLKRYAADVVAHNNVAFCQTQLRQMSEAVASMRQATGILPKRALYRLNLALYSSYASDFEAAAEEAMTTRDLGNSLGWQPLAYAQAGQERIADAIRSYEALMKTNAQGASIATSGLADIAVYEGRFAEAVRLYEAGARTDLERKNPDRAAAKLAGLAYAQLQRGRTAAARAAATEAIAASRAIRPRVQAARVLIDVGDIPAAQAVATQLASEPQVEAQASAKVLLGSMAMSMRDYPGAITLLTAANMQLDTWMGQFELGRARLAAGQHTAADSAFDRCMTRSGELFLDEEPTFGRLPAVYYLQGQAREGGKIVGFDELYRRYLRIREKAGEDPQLKDVKRRAGL